MKPSSARSQGITRPEIVFVMAVVLLATSLIAPGIVGVRQHRQFVQARADITSLLAAGERFFREYGAWPTSQTGEEGDVRFGRERPISDLIHALSAIPGPGNEGGSVNPQHIVFLRREGVVEGEMPGDFLDPWGTPYQVVVDSNFDNTCEVRQSIYGRLLGEGIVIWSCGPDQKSDTPDDILSWKMPGVR
jgi:type II secretory pathway pseudopilin PulG